MENFRRICFFCGDDIQGKKTLEHVIPNSLLGRLGIKESLISGQKDAQYSRIKVPAHSECNNEFGSNYENRILEFLENTDTLYETIKSEETPLPLMYSPGNSATEIFTTWLSKIYYGLFYYDLLTSKDASWQAVCTSILTDQNFNFVRTSYKNGYGFQLPSSLFVFRTNITDIDLITRVSPSSILLKIENLTLILCLCDGYLTKNYLNGEILECLREYVRTEDEIDTRLPAHKYAFAEILALRSCIPKTPKFLSSDTQIVNMSLSTGVSNPKEFYKIDNAQLKIARINALLDLKIQYIEPAE